MFPLQFIDAIAEALESDMGAGYFVQTEPLDVTSMDKYISVFPMSWTPVQDSQFISQVEPALNQYQIKIQNLTIHGEIEVAYTQFTNDQRKIRAILYRDATLRVSLAGMQETYLGSVERFKKLHVVRQTSLPARRAYGMYFLCETDIQIDTETTVLP